MPDMNPVTDNLTDSHLLENDDERFERLFSVGRLRSTWRSLRRELRYITSRDVIDWTDWAIAIDASLPQICVEIIQAVYVPLSATRIEDGKTRGAFRIFTSLNVKDALIYRHICDFALELAMPRKVAGAFFSKRYASTPVGRTFDTSPDPSDRFYAIWLRYNEYRSRTLLNEPYDIWTSTRETGPLKMLIFSQN